MHVRVGNTRYQMFHIFSPINRKFPFMHRLRFILILSIDKKEKPVLHDWPSQSKTINITPLFRTFTQIFPVHFISTEILVLNIHISGTTKLIRTTLGHRINRCSDKISLPHIIRSNTHLNFIQCIYGNRITATR